MKYTHEDVQRLNAIGDYIEAIKDADDEAILGSIKILQDAEDLIEQKGIPDSLVSECIDCDSMTHVLMRFVKMIDKRLKALERSIEE